MDCENPLIAVTLLSLGVSIAGSVYSGFFVNHMDIAPQFAGTLLGLGNGIAAATGFIAPYTVAVMTKQVGRLALYLAVKPNNGG